jgi:hypothetical protein
MLPNRVEEVAQAWRSMIGERAQATSGTQFLNSAKRQLS